MLRPADGAGVFELATGNAILLAQCQLRLQLLRLRVRTPLAAQRAALQEDIRAHARPIVHGHALHVEDHATNSLQPRSLGRLQSI
jgi:hypothetical protein